MPSAIPNPEATTHPTTFDLNGVDCSDGLARCAGGHVEISRAAHISFPCSGPRCACPWEAAGECPRGCLAEGEEVVVPAAVAHLQLCRSEEALTRPVTAADQAEVTICDEEGVACVDAVVRACGAAGQPATPIVRCAHGCTSGVVLDLRNIGDGRAAILCQHRHPTR